MLLDIYKQYFYHVKMSKTKRRPLTETEKSNAENLHRIFLQWQKESKDKRERWGQEVVADYLEISQSAFSQLLLGKTVPTMHMWKKICEFFDVHPSEIGANIADAMTEIAEVVKIKKPEEGDLLGDKILLPPQENYIRLEHFDIQSSSGHGKFAPEYQSILQTLDVLEDWALSNFGKNPVDKIKIINNSGDSMAPTIQDGDILFVDITRNAFEAEGIYILDWNGRLLTKRLVAQSDGRLAIISDNKSYDPEYVNEKNIDSLVICGLVRGWWSFKRF